MKNSKEDYTSINKKKSRIISNVPFVTIILFLGGWSVGFYSLQRIENGVIPDNLRCVIFFGGLFISIFIGALLGSILKRIINKFWIR